MQSHPGSNRYAADLKPNSGYEIHGLFRWDAALCEYQMVAGTKNTCLQQGKRSVGYAILYIIVYNHTKDIPWSCSWLYLASFNKTTVSSYGVIIM